MANYTTVIISLITRLRCESLHPLNYLSLYELH